MRGDGRRSGPRLGGAALLAVLVGGGAAMAGAVDLNAILSERGDPASCAAAIEATRREAALRPDDPQAAAALTRARYFAARAHAEGDEAARRLQVAVDAGLEALGRALDRSLDSVAALDRRRDEVPEAAVGLLYWVTLSYGSTIESMGRLRQPGAARRFQRLLRRAAELDDAYFHAGPRRVLAELLYQAPRIVGGDAREAREQAERAVQMAPGFAENHVVWAEVVAAPDGDTGAYRAALERALSLPDADGADYGPEQRLAKQRARGLLRALNERR